MTTVEDMIKQLEKYPKSFFVFASEDVGGNGLVIIDPNNRYGGSGGFIPAPDSD